MKKFIVATNSLKPLAEMGGNIISRENMKIFSAASGEEIIKIHRAEKVDIIITDLKLPDMDGDKLSSFIRSSYTLKKVSIMLICDDDKAAIERCENCEANAFIKKPINPQELFRCISKLLHVPVRKKLRAIMRVSIKCETNNKFFFAKSNNISSTGILFETDKVLKKGGKVKCLFPIGTNQIAANGKIVRVEKKAKDHNLYGVQFLKLSPAEKDGINKFIEESIAHSYRKCIS